MIANKSSQRLICLFEENLNRIQTQRWYRRKWRRDIRPNRFSADVGDDKASDTLIIVGLHGSELSFN